MPSKNRPLVRDGRLQAKKKRTDRSYLSPSPRPATSVDEPDEEATDTVTVADDAPVEHGAAATDRAPVMAPVAPDAADNGWAAPPGRLPATVRAMQQQGVRKRRAFDVHALAVRDSQYAVHEMRRIFVLSAMVIVTLIVLGFVLR